MTTEPIPASSRALAAPAAGDHVTIGTPVSPASKGHARERMSPAHQRQTLAVLCLAFFCTAFDNTKLIVAMPSLARHFASQTALLNWIPEAGLLVYASLLMLGGALSERFGARRMLLLGIAIFGAGSLAASAVSSAGPLIAMRAVTALGAALITPATLAAVKTRFHESQRGRAIAMWTASYGVGAAMGPVLSGVLLEHFFWGSVLLVNVPVAALAWAGAYRWLPAEAASRSAPLDGLGAALALAATGCLIYAILEGPRLGWLASPVWATAAASLALYAALITWQRTARHPMLDPVLFGIRPFRLALSVILVGYLAFSGVSYVIAQYLQLVRAFAPSQAGMLTLPLAAAMFAGTLLAPSLSARWGARRALVGSLLAAAAGASSLALFSANAFDLGLCVAMLPFGAGCGSAFVNATDVVIGIAPHDRAGGAAAVNETAFEFGGVVGVAVLSSVLGAPTLPAFALARGAVHAMWVGAGAFVLAALIALAVDQGDGVNAPG